MRHTFRSLTSTTALAAILFLGSLMSSSAQEAAESRFGADDQIGAANFLTPEVVCNATDLVTEGKTYQLGIVVTEETQGPGGRVTVNTMLPLRANESETFVDDYFVGHLSVGTQIDGLGHAVVHGHAYNNTPLGEIIGLNGLSRLGVETIPPIATRGVALDIAAVRGVDFMRPGDAITVDDIEAAMERQGVQIGRGDVVLLHTGWMDEMLREDPSTYVNIEPGLGVPAARYLAGLDVVAVGLDVAQLDPIDVPTNYNRPAHGVLLQQNGVYVLENVNTSVLVADEVHEFLFVLAPLRIEGAAQSPVNPVAIR